MALTGNIPVIPTPFNGGGIDYTGFDRLMARTAHALDGCVICGSTGEAPALTKEERIAVADYFAAHAPKHLEIVIGLGHTSLPEAVEIGRRAADKGIRAALVPSPYYFPNSLDMVIDYVGRLGEQTGLDLVFYDNPVTTKTRFAAEELMKLASAVPQVKAIKMTDHHFGKIRALKAETGLQVFGGDDIICFRAFEAGVDGNMIIAPIVYPDEFKRCWELYREGNREASFKLYCEALLPFISMFGPGDEIPTTKALFQRLGIFDSAETRSPLLASDGQRCRELMLGYEAGLNKGG